MVTLLVLVQSFGVRVPIGLPLLKLLARAGSFFVRSNAIAQWWGGL